MVSKNKHNILGESLKIKKLKKIKKILLGKLFSKIFKWFGIPNKPTCV